MSNSNDAEVKEIADGKKSKQFKNIKLVALDLDGTLLDDDFNISQRTCEVMRKLTVRGIKIVLVTGRTLRSAYYVRKSIALDIPIVAYNGGKVIIPPTGEVHSVKIPLSEAIKIIKYGEERDLYVKVYIDDLLYVEKDEEVSRIFSTRNGIEYSAVGKLSENIGQDVNMIVMYYNEPIHGEIDDKLNGIDVNITASATVALDFIPKGVSKDKGLKLVADYFNIKRDEILAIGNSKNDIEMLKFAGIGIAMKNADSMLLKEWNLFTEYTNNEEGVYHILKQI